MTRTLTAWEEWQLSWALEGELRLDLITYYAICCTCGYVQGFWIGTQITRFLGG